MRCCVLLFAVVALVVTVARADSYVLNTSMVVNNVGFDGDVVDLRYVQYSPEKQPSITLNQSQVVGGGLKILGYQVEIFKTDKRVSVSVYDTYVTDATITLDGYMPHNTSLVFANVTANLKLEKPLFILSSMHLHSQTSLTVQGVFAKWDAAASSGWVAQLTTTGERVTIQDGSGLFFLQVVVDNGAGVVSVTTESGMLIAHNSVFAVDYVSTKTNHDAVVSISQPTTIDDGSTFRITNVASDGKPVLKADSSVSVVNDSLFLLSNINVTTGSLFDVTTSINLKNQSVFTYHMLRAPATGLSATTPSLSDDTSAAYGRSCFIGSTKLKTIADYENKKMHITTFVTDDGYEDGTKTCAYEQCTPTHYTKPTKPRDACACMCNGEYSVPTCSTSSDPVVAFVEIYNGSAACSVPNCAQCPGLPSVCTSCATGYKLVGEYCVRQEPPTTTTTTRAPTTVPPGPQPLPPHFCSEHCNWCESTCYGCSTLICRQCERGYVVQGRAICVKQYSGAHVTTALPATIGMLLLGAGAAYAV